MILGEWTLSGSSWASPPFRRRTGAFTLQAQILPGLQAACSKAIAGQTEHGFVGLWGRPGRIGQSERAFPVLRETVISKRPVRLPSNPSTQPTVHPSTHPQLPGLHPPSYLLSCLSLRPVVLLLRLWPRSLRSRQGHRHGLTKTPAPGLATRLSVRRDTSRTGTVAVIP